jgi:hypothetical protein
MEKKEMIFFFKKKRKSRKRNLNMILTFNDKTVFPNSLVLFIYIIEFLVYKYKK